MQTPAATGDTRPTRAVTGDTRRTLAVMAHYDPDGLFAPHAARNAAALAAAADRVLVVSTAPLTDAAKAAVPPGVELVQRLNVGYDFYGWKIGLDLAGYRDYERVVICNDSYVGPLIPYQDVFAAMDTRPVDFWGMSQTRRRAHHVQSYFVAFNPWVVRSRAMERFWASMVPVSDRLEVIRRYEVGLSVSLVRAGFALGSYFEETAADARLARARHLWWAANSIRLRPPGKRLRAARTLPAEPWNPMSALADRALDGARLPIVKLDTLRYDPYRLGSGDLLDKAERQYPDQFAGVREFLLRTGSTYRPRALETGAHHGGPPALVRAALGY